MKRGINWFKRIFGIHSTIDALKSILIKSDFKRLLLMSPDRRECIEVASRITGTSVDTLLRQISSILDLPALIRIDTESAGIRERFQDKELLYKAAAVPLVKDNTLVGIVCVDPALIAHVFPQFKDIPLCIAPWKVVKQKLDSIDWECEVTPQPLQVDSETLSKKILTSIYDEVRRFSEDKAHIQFDPKLQFLIPLQDGKTATGAIRQEAKQGLFEFLCGNLSVELGDTKLFVTPSHDKKSFLLNYELRERDNEEQAPLELEPHSIKESTHKSLALLIDDNETFVKVLERYLSKIDVSSCCAMHGAHALEVLQNMPHLPSLIICDIHMPIMNGFEFIRRIKDDERYQAIPVVMLTSDTDVEAEIALLACGVDAFVGKQEDPRVLCMHAKRLLQKTIYKKAA